MLIDSHTHLDHEYFINDQKDIINKLPECNVGLVINASSDIESCIASMKLSEEHSSIYALLGVHPENCMEYDNKAKNFIRKNATSPKVVGIGEIGLDYHYEGYDKQVQAEVFLDQARIAYELKLPVIVHLRDAYGDFLTLLESNVYLFEYGLLLHCFSGSIEFANRVMSLVPNVYFAFGGSCTFKNAKNVQETVKHIPLDKILTETDCPFLTPEPLRGKEKNQPKNIKYILQQIADIKEISFDKMSQIVERNLRTLFKKIK